MTTIYKMSRARTLGMTVLALVILLPALYGFGRKFIEFLALAGDPDGAFTVVPILNYLLMSAGFLVLFGWAVLHGMFREIERPKHAMLDNERRLDEEEERERAEEGSWNYGGD